MEHTQQWLTALNNIIPINYLWDGFWIDSFNNGELNVSASFDQIYYRDIMIVYSGVTFFNLPQNWRDNYVVLPWMQFANKETFIQQYPKQDITDKIIIQWQLGDGSTTNAIHTFYIVCSNIKVYKCNDEQKDYEMTYKDPYAKNDYINNRFKNRVAQ